MTMELNATYRIIDADSSLFPCIMIMSYHIMHALLICTWISMYVYFQSKTNLLENCNMYSMYFTPNHWHSILETELQDPFCAC